MKLNRKHLDIILTTLRKVFQEGQFAHSAVSTSLSGVKGLTEEERHFAVTTIYGVIRDWRLLWEVLGQRMPKEGVELSERDLLRVLAAYLILDDKRIDNDPKLGGLVSKKRVRENRERLEGKRAVAGSVTDWMDARGSQELGDDWPRVLSSLNQDPPVFIRANTLKNTPGELLKVLEKEGVKTALVDWSPHALEVKEQRTSLFRTRAFRDGRFEMQDAASQMVGIMLDPKPGMTVVDACAGEGGKTLHLAALMENHGRLLAMDLLEHKLVELKRRARRAGAANIIETRAVSGTKSYKRLAGKADRLLLDAPCSGTGVLRRKPDIKWGLDQASLDNMIRTQDEILNSYQILLAPGGRMVYAVCSVLPSEGELRVEDFLETHPGFRLLEEQRYWPHQCNGDGFYIAVLTRE